MASESILIVDDDIDICELLKTSLINAGFETYYSNSGVTALNFMKTLIPDLILLDVLMPGMTGIEFCEEIRSKGMFSNIPIIMLTTEGQEESVIKGLEAGADDYIVKNVSTNVIIARIKTVLRRKLVNRISCDDENTVLKVDNLLIDPKRYEVLINSTPISLSVSEFKILHFLAVKPGWVYTRNQILDEIYNDDAGHTDRSIDVLITGLRKKLGEYSKYIETIRGVGYSFTENY